MLPIILAAAAAGFSFLRGKTRKNPGRRPHNRRRVLRKNPGKLVYWYKMKTGGHWFSLVARPKETPAERLSRAIYTDASAIGAMPSGMSLGTWRNMASNAVYHPKHTVSVPEKNPGTSVARRRAEDRTLFDQMGARVKRKNPKKKSRGHVFRATVRGGDGNLGDLWEARTKTALRKSAKRDGVRLGKSTRHRRAR